MPETLKMVVFRIMQEAFNNAAKYSRADRMELDLANSSDTIKLTIADNGRGFDVDAVQARQTDRNGFGLASMRERVELSGGTFCLHSAPGQGTVIEAVWPLAARDDSESF